MVTRHTLFARMLKTRKAVIVHKVYAVEGFAWVSYIHAPDGIKPDLQFVVALTYLAAF